ncbi:hypothetical protein BDV40DRAFT_283471 [Aspergillus tamarii]|uniref:Uncharacterized protein n=1 Tax=Aspergillus tamarii TaxID=41984 RepID=A0A5N6UAD2_ASPTM|nr:hypothetical protein BDV40DRAFT_283471 [Aspergillus tamarii]
MVIALSAHERGLLSLSAVFRIIHLSSLCSEILVRESMRLPRYRLAQGMEAPTTQQDGKRILTWKNALFGRLWTP